MQALIISDVHTEFHRDHGRSFVQALPDADLVILAGDITVPHNPLEPLRYFCNRYKHVVWLPGNHEYYMGSPAGMNKIWEQFAASTPNFHWLRDSAVEIEGQRFIGGTLWFAPFPNMKQHQHWLNDFRVITGFDPWVFEQNRATRAYLEKEILPDDVVVTHHVPSWLSCHPKYAGSPYNRFFVCPEAEDILTAKQPKIWVHGHTHDSFDYMFGKTRIVCNPFGYARQEENPGFNTHKIIELGVVKPLCPAPTEGALCPQPPQMSPETGSSS